MEELQAAETKKTELILACQSKGDNRLESFTEDEATATEGNEYASLQDHVDVT